MSGARKYNVDESFFERIDSKEKAYFLGWLASDGYVNLKKGAFAISLQERDKEVLEKLNFLIKNERPLTKIIYDKPGQENWKNQYRLNVSSRKMSNDLSKILVCRNKSKEIVMPEIPDGLLNEFIKGIFEGDGNIYFQLTKKNYLQTSFSIYSASEKFIDSIISLINNQCSVNLTKKINNYNVFIANTTGFLNLQKVLDWIYKDKEERFLERKYKKWLEMQEIREDKFKKKKERTNRSCSILGCEEKHHANEFCKKHNWKYWSQGDSLFTPKKDIKRPVSQYDLEGNLINKWDCVKLASKALDIFINNIEEVCKNRTGSSGGFQWRYEKDSLEKIGQHILTSHNGKQVVKTNKKTGEETLYLSLKRASDSVGLSQHYIKKFIKKELIDENSSWDFIDQKSRTN